MMPGNALQWLWYEVEHLKQAVSKFLPRHGCRQTLQQQTITTSVNLKKLMVALLDDQYVLYQTDLSKNFISCRLNVRTYILFEVTFTYFSSLDSLLCDL
jgi:hypothetical protein